jgi:hypothetical protein
MRATTIVALAGLVIAPGGGTATAQTPVTGPVEIPLEVSAGRMTVPVRAADGTELRFLVTTGSAVTVLSESGERRAGGRALTLGGVPVNMEGSVTLPDSDLTVDGVVLDGLVSNNTLNAFDVLLDAPGGRLVLKPVGRSVEWQGIELSDPVRLRVYHGVVLALDVELDGTAYPAMLELGAPKLLVNQQVLDETGITGGVAKDLRLGSTTFHDVPVELSDHPSIARFSPNGDGFVVVGTPPALACPVAISWVHRELRTCAP